MQHLIQLFRQKLYLRMLAMFLVIGLAGLFTMALYPQGETVTFTIPPGTSQRLAAGENAVQFPAEITLTTGDTIVIENQDEVVHNFGPFVILPNTTLTKQFETAHVYQNTCTFHQDRQMTLIVNPAPWRVFQ